VSGQHVFDDAAFDVGEAAFDAVVVERQSFVIEAQQVEDGGVEVVDGADVEGGAVAEVVGRRPSIRMT
jgi:hypothetical protein